MLDFIITGPARSGTTGLVHLMNQDPRVFCGHELDIELNYHNHMINSDYHKLTLERVLESGGPMNQDMDKKGLDFNEFKRRAIETSNTLELYEIIKSLGDFALIGDKHPDYVLWKMKIKNLRKLPVIMEEHKDLKVILCIRDGRSIIASHLRGENSLCRYENVIECQEYINGFIASLHEICKRPDYNDRVMFVEYERALRKTDVLIKGLNSFLNYDFNIYDPSIYREYHTIEENLAILPKDYKNNLTKAFIEYQTIFNYPI